MDTADSVTSISFSLTLSAKENIQLTSNWLYNVTKLSDKRTDFPTGVSLYK